MAFVMLYLSSESSSIDNPSIKSGIYLSSSALRLFSTKTPSSNGAKLIMSSICSYNDIAYGIYENYGCILSASEYRNGVYANAIENFRKIQLHVKRLFL